MHNSTDLKTVDQSATSLVLLAVAEHFTETDPTAELEQVSLLVAFGAEAYRLTQGKLDGNGQKLAKAAFALAPELISGTTRGEYALIMRRAVAEAGHDWPDGPNDPAIPRIKGIPGPRTEPTPGKRPAVPTQPTPKAVR